MNGEEIDSRKKIKANTIYQYKQEIGDKRKKDGTNTVEVV